MRERAAELERQMSSELERVRRSLRAEIVPYGAYEPQARRTSIPIERDAKGARPG